MQTAQHAYLETQILSSTPQRLRLIAIVAAQRFAIKAAEAWAVHDGETALDSAQRARGLVLELLAGMDPAAEVLATERDVLIFLAEALTQAIGQCDQQAVLRAADVLQELRTTWTLICDKEPLAPPTKPLSEVTISKAGKTSATAHPVGGATYGSAGGGHDRRPGSFRLEG